MKLFVLQSFSTLKKLNVFLFYFCSLPIFYILGFRSFAIDMLARMLWLVEGAVHVGLRPDKKAFSLIC